MVRLFTLKINELYYHPLALGLHKVLAVMKAALLHLNTWLNGRALKGLRALKFGSPDRAPFRLLIVQVVMFVFLLLVLYRAQAYGLPGGPSGEDLTLSHRSAPSQGIAGSTFKIRSN